MGLFIGYLSARTQAIINALIYFLCFLFTGAAAWQTVVHATYILNEGKHTEMIRIPSAPFFYIFALGWALMSVVCLIITISSLFHKEAV